MDCTLAEGETFDVVVVLEDLGEVFEAGVADESEVDVGQVADAD